MELQQRCGLCLKEGWPATLLSPERCALVLRGSAGPACQLFCAVGLLDEFGG